MAPPQNVVLYSHRYCPYTNVVMMAMAHTEVDYRWEQLDPPANPADKEKVLAINKDGTVPVVEWGERRITNADEFLGALETAEAADDAHSVWRFANVDREAIRKWVEFGRDELAGPLMKVLMGSAPPVYVPC